jgi:two-component system, OmpR family, sensor kinase
VTSLHRSGSFRRKIVFLTAVVTAGAMLLLTLVLQLLLSRLTNQDIDWVLQDREAAVIGSVQTASTGSGLVVPDSRLEVGVAVYDATGRLVAGAPPVSLRAEYERLRTSTTTQITTVGETDRIRTEPFRTGNGSKGVVVANERLAPYEETERNALLLSLVTAALTTAAAAGIAAWVTRRALAPVHVMATTAADWSEHDLGKRFDLGPPTNEISALGATLDTLLDKVSAAIRSEQRLTAELAHELRTPLTTVQGTADLILLREQLPPDLRADLEQISASGHRMAATISTLLELAREGTSLLDGSTSSLAEVADDVAQAAPSSRVRLVVDVADLRLALPHGLALRALTPVVENAVRHARTLVTVTAAPSSGGHVDVFVDDDGPGVPVADAERIFEPGTTSGPGSGTGLGLAISRRIARSVGGDALLDDTDHGARFVVRLPRF